MPDRVHTGESPTLTEVVERADEIAEALGGLLRDPVVRAYVMERERMLRPLFVSMPDAPPDEALIERWDQIVGDLQRSGALPIPKGASVEVVEDG